MSITCVGSYGIRRIGSLLFSSEQYIDYVLSSIFRGIPFSWGFRPAMSFTAGMDPLSLRSGADHPFHCVATNGKWCLQSSSLRNGSSHQNRFTALPDLGFFQNCKGHGRLPEF